MQIKNDCEFISPFEICRSVIYDIAVDSIILSLSDELVKTVCQPIVSKAISDAIASSSGSETVLEAGPQLGFFNLQSQSSNRSQIVVLDTRIQDQALDQKLEQRMQNRARFKEQKERKRIDELQKEKMIDDPVIDSNEFEIIML